MILRREKVSAADEVTVATDTLLNIHKLLRNKVIKSPLGIQPKFKMNNLLMESTTEQNPALDN
jgi:hypothetical protein